MKAVYPGTFDPVTNGHVDIIERASSIFEEIIVTISHNVKKQCLFSLEERLNMLTICAHKYPNVSVAICEKLTAEFAREMGAGAIIRGLRAVSDFEIELKTALMNRHLNPDLETVFLMTREKYLFLNSSIIREVASFGGNIAEFVPTHVVESLRNKYNSLQGESTPPP